MASPDLNPLAALPIEFIGSFPDPVHPLVPAAPEFVFIGRSNVGKSSLLNALIARKAVARVSATPGKTELVNVYRLPPFYLLDVPGYGFANTGHAARKAYRELLERLVRERTSLTGVVWLLDIRHRISDDDVAFQTLLAESGRSVLAVLTKADKLGRAAQATALRDRGRETGITEDQIQMVSANTGLGIVDLARTLLAAASETP